MPESLRVQDLGEQALLQKLHRFCPTELVGDDAALLTVAAGHSLVVTTDMLVDTVHFSDRTTSPSDVGWRATAANLSDLAAMAASPLGITISLGLPDTLPVAWVEQLYQGIAECLQPFVAPIVGGDLCRSAVTTVSITAFGQVLPDRAIKRSAAKPGDVILVTGVHGASRAGLELLLHPEQGQTLTEAVRSALITAHQRPKPRLDVVEMLQEIWEAEGRGQRAEGEPGSRGAGEPERGGEGEERISQSFSPSSPSSVLTIAGMDSSDGLADAVLQICRASGVGARLERGQILLPAGITEWISEEQAINWALYGGEDFELVLCLPLAVAEAMVQRLPGATLVGTITEAPMVVLTDRSGDYADELLSLDRGFQHF